MFVSNNKEFFLKTKRNLAERFEMKDFEEIYYILGVKIMRNQKIYITYINHQKYVENILERFDIKVYKSLATSLDSNKKLSRDMNLKILEDIKTIKEILYQNTIGSLV